MAACDLVWRSRALYLVEKIAHYRRVCNVIRMITARVTRIGYKVQLGQRVLRLFVHILAVRRTDKFVACTVNKTNRHVALPHIVYRVYRGEIVAVFALGHNVGKIDYRKGRQVRCLDAQLAKIRIGAVKRTVGNDRAYIATQRQLAKHRYRAHAFAVQYHKGVFAEKCARIVQHRRQIVPLVVAKRCKIAVGQAEIGMVVYDNVVAFG